ncbi:hypothetical protein ARMSODRAFT_1007934 [Armillaria solidipes]|uniref:DUF6534 domain-containing protein n=1 Tax=Armillaria solidipes TaxID=1076256 RepID=A0A2H3BAD1_9AGAR|nr:hypothetical protein ARMSODRAFT_1007934 [Armillaria solidipes]
MSSQPSLALPSLGDTFGALFVGATIAAVLYGIMNLQVLIYYKNYPNDWSLYCRAVALFWVLDTVHIALGTHALYYYLIDMYGNLLGSLEANIICPNWTFHNQLQSLVKVWTIVFVQGVYAIRLWKLGRHFHKIVPWLVYRKFVLEVAGSYATTQSAVYTFYSMVITADLIIALMMCYYLHKSRAAMCFSSDPRSLVDYFALAWLTYFSVLSDLSSYQVHARYSLSLRSDFSQFEAFRRSHEDLQYAMWPNTFIFVAIDFILPRLYINSLLAMFNHRQSSNKSTTDSEDMRHSIPAVLQFAPNTSEGHATETNVSLPLSEIPDYSVLTTHWHIITPLDSHAEGTAEHVALATDNEARETIRESEPWPARCTAGKVVGAVKYFVKDSGAKRRGEMANGKGHTNPRLYLELHTAIKYCFGCWRVAPFSDIDDKEACITIIALLPTTTRGICRTLSQSENSQIEIWKWFVGGFVVAASFKSAVTS